MSSITPLFFPRHVKGLLSFLFAILIPSLYADDLQITQPLQAIYPQDGELVCSVQFDFINVGNKPIVIREIQLACDCLAAQLEQRNYQAGERGQVSVSFTIGDREGEQRKQCTLVTDAGEKQSLTMIVHTPPQPDFSAHFVSWTVGEAAQQREITITLPSKATYTLSIADSVTPGFITNLQRGVQATSYKLRKRPVNSLNSTASSQPLLSQV